MISLDYDNLREKLSDLKELNIYLPLLLSSYIHPDYLDKLDDKEKEKYYQHRVELMGAEDYSLYFSPYIVYNEGEKRHKPKSRKEKQ